MKTLNYRGKVSSGKGEGARFIELPWVKKEIKEKLGFNAFPGTLNITLSGDHTDLKKMLKKAKSTEISPSSGFCHGSCFNAYLMDSHECVVIVPDVPNYSENQAEVIAPINLRKKLRLKDGDDVTLRILLE